MVFVLWSWANHTPIKSRGRIKKSNRITPSYLNTEWVRNIYNPIFAIEFRTNKDLETAIIHKTLFYVWKECSEMKTPRTTVSRSTLVQACISEGWCKSTSPSVTYAKLLMHRLIVCPWPCVLCVQIRFDYPSLVFLVQMEEQQQFFLQ